MCFHPELVELVFPASLKLMPFQQLLLEEHGYSVGALQLFSNRPIQLYFPPSHILTKKIQVVQFQIINHPLRKEPSDKRTLQGIYWNSEALSTLVFLDPVFFQQARSGSFAASSSPPRKAGGNDVEKTRKES